MRTKCRRLFQDAAEATLAQCTWGNSQLGKPAGEPQGTPTRLTHQAGYRFTIGPLTGKRTQDDGRGSGSGSECSTVSRDTARVSAT
jgi:hypothetical protein